MSEIEELRRADVQLMQALRQTQLEHSKVLEAHSKLLGALVSGQVAMMEQLGSLSAHVGAITNHLGIAAPDQSPED
ncbi:hypothetical protein ACFYZB_19185 [Streptomyces sp. NPDC001852]|uniref:hypothetical protein n=1 Tax=Streptomyces sp. NPDC001852 TaxID=3364619 RepID=UPI0036BA5C43